MQAIRVLVLSGVIGFGFLTHAQKTYAECVIAEGSEVAAMSLNVRVLSQDSAEVTFNTEQGEAKDTCKVTSQSNDSLNVLCEAFDIENPEKVIGSITLIINGPSSHILMKALSQSGQRDFQTFSEMSCI